MKPSELLMAETVNSDWYRDFIAEEARRHGVIQTNVFEQPSYREGTLRVRAALEQSRPSGLARVWDGLVDWLNG